MYDSAGLTIEAGEYHQAAIDRAIEVYGIDTKAAKAVVFDSDLAAEGMTKKGVVHIGKEAFRDAGYLGSTIAHEAEVHAVQFAHNNIAAMLTGGRYLDEAEA